jgi:hypothetical protein
LAKSDPALAYGLKSKSKRMRRDETPDKFLARLVRDCPAVIKKCKGDLPTVALVFGVQLPMMEDVVAANRKTVGQALAKARALAAAELQGDQSKVDEAREKLDEVVEDKQVDKRLKRRNWPQDVGERVSQISDALVVSLVENNGDIKETSECLNVPIHEILDLVDTDDEVAGALEQGQRVQASIAESQAFKRMQNGDNAMIKMVLTNLHGDRWAERQKVDVKRVGFAPPEKDEAEEVSVLSIVKGER